MKKNRKKTSLLVLVLLLVTLGAVLPKIFVKTRMMPPDSLIRLIAAPEKFHKKRVRVNGFLQLEFEGNALYLHQEDAQFVMTANAVWVEASEDMMSNAEKFHSKHIYIEGVFNAKRHGHMGLFSGAIEDVSRCYLIENIREGTEIPSRGAEGSGGSEESNP